MEFRAQINGCQYLADLNTPFDCSIAISASGITAWGLKHAKIQPHRDGDFIGSVKLGSAVNFNDVYFNPHAHGTHTECLGHITKKEYSIQNALPLPLIPMRLITVKPRQVDGDYVIDLDQIKAALPIIDVSALMIRTRLARSSNLNWSGTNPPYLYYEAAQWLADSGIDHLLLDLPSVDREQDGGVLAAHKAFWGLPEKPRIQATITELISVPDELEDGLYLLNLQVAALDNDASPSRPLLFRLIPC